MLVARVDYLVSVAVAGIEEKFILDFEIRVKHGGYNEVAKRQTVVFGPSFRAVVERYHVNSLYEQAAS